jgi:hypothetical protein
MLTAVLGLLMASDNVVNISMRGPWIRRDWQQCQDATRIEFSDEAVTFSSNSSSAQVWQSPLRTGPVEVDPQLGWVQQCAPAPRSYVLDEAKRIAANPDAIRLSDFPWLTWRWRVSDTVDDSELADGNGRIGRSEFAAQLSLIFQDTNARLPQELAYVWTRSKPRETVLYEETTVIPLFLKFRLYRIVAESGPAHVGEWTEEARNVLADYARIHPGGHARALLRVYLMASSNYTKAKLTTAFGDIAFRRRAPKP